MRKGFTLVEMLVVVGIIAILIAASIGGYSSFIKKAARTRCSELVHDVQVALVAVMQKEDAWPRAILSAQGAPKDGIFTKEAGAALAKRGALSLSYKKTTDENGATVYELTGNDRYGIVTPWAADLVKRNATKDKNGHSIEDHRLHFAVDDDFDGITDATVGGVGIQVRASAIVWCCGEDGVISAYPYAGGGSGGKTDDVYSWAPEQVVK